MKGVAGLLLGIAATGLVAGGATERPTRIQLPDRQMAHVVGGAGAAILDLKLPQDLVTSPLNSFVPTATWNKGGARCLFSCTGGTHPGAASQGFDANAPLVLQLSGIGLPVPVLEVSGDGRLRARTSAQLLGTIGGYDLYKASLATKCKDGPHPGIICNGTNICGSGASGGECLVHDHTGATNTCGALGCSADGPCGFSVCNAPATNAGKVCTTSTDCPISGGGFAACTANALQSPARTCYAMANCGVGGGCTDCRQTGAGLTSGATGTARNIHTVRARAISPAVGQAGATFAQLDSTYQWVLGDSSDPGLLCSSNCSGVTDTCVIVPPDPVCKPQPTNCG
jgi:hypothetical protein